MFAVGWCAAPAASLCRGIHFSSPAAFKLHHQRTDVLAPQPLDVAGATSTSTAGPWYCARPPTAHLLAPTPPPLPLSTATCRAVPPPRPRLLLCPLLLPPMARLSRLVPALVLVPAAVLWAPPAAAAGGLRRAEGWECGPCFACLACLTNTRHTWLLTRPALPHSPLLLQHFWLAGGLQESTPRCRRPRAFSPCRRHRHWHRLCAGPRAAALAAAAAAAAGADNDGAEYRCHRLGRRWVGCMLWVGPHGGNVAVCIVLC